MLQPRPGCPIPGGEPGDVQDLNLKFRMAGQKRGHRPLILLGGEGAGGVHQTPAGGQKLRRCVQNPGLPPGAHLHQLWAPVFQGGCLLPEHPLPGAGGIHQHPVEPAGKPLGQPLRRLLEYQGVGNGHALHVLGENFGTLWVILVAYQQALPSHLGRQLGGLAAGSGAQIQDPQARLHPQQLRRGHGAGLLQVVQPRLMPGVQAGPLL